MSPQPCGAEKRIKCFQYYNGTVYNVTGFLNIPFYIEFENGETVNTVATALENKWMFEIKGQKLFLKALSEDGDTIATVMTNKRTYFLELHVKIANGPFDSRLVFGLHFKYPDDSQVSNGGDASSETSVVKYATSTDNGPDLKKPENYNFNYTMAGAENISPIKIFDDGLFTYMEFRNKNSTLPAIFGVDSNGYEYIMNFRVVGDYIILESVNPTLTLRNGADTLCVFNESMKRQEVTFKRPVNPKK